MRQHAVAVLVFNGVQLFAVSLLELGHLELQAAYFLAAGRQALPLESEISVFLVGSAQFGLHEGDGFSQLCGLLLAGVDDASALFEFLLVLAQGGKERCHFFVDVFGLFDFDHQGPRFAGQLLLHAFAFPLQTLSLAALFVGPPLLSFVGFLKPLQPAELVFHELQFHLLLQALSHQAVYLARTRGIHLGLALLGFQAAVFALQLAHPGF